MFWEYKGVALTLTVSVFQIREEDGVLGVKWTAWKTAPCFNIRLTAGLPSTYKLVIDTTSLNIILT